MAVPKDLAGELYWLNYYVDQEFVVDFPLRDRFHQWVLDTLKEVFLFASSFVGHALLPSPRI